MDLRVESVSVCINKHLRVVRCVFGCFLVREIAHYTPPYLSTHVSNALKSHTTERSKRPLPDSLTCVHILAKIDQVVGKLGTILINHISCKTTKSTHTVTRYSNMLSGLSDCGTALPFIVQHISELPKRLRTWAKFGKGEVFFIPNHTKRKHKHNRLLTSHILPPGVQNRRQMCDTAKARNHLPVCTYLQAVFSQASE